MDFTPLLSCRPRQKQHLLSVRRGWPLGRALLDALGERPRRIPARPAPFAAPNAIGAEAFGLLAPAVGMAAQHCDAKRVLPIARGKLAKDPELHPRPFQDRAFVGTFIPSGGPAKVVEWRWVRVPA